MKKKFFIGLFIAAVIGLGAYASFVFKQEPEYKQDNIKAPIDIPSSEIKRVQGNLDIQKPSLLMFYVDWCGYCKRFMPMYGEAAAKYSKDFDFYVVNCELPENENLTRGHYISAFPTIFINDKDLDFEYQLSNSATSNLKLFYKELDNHLKLRAKLKK